MTTPDELRTILQRLAGYCAAIEDDLHDSAYPAAASSNAGAAPVGPKGKPPCSIVDLDYIIEDVAPIIRGWCTALQKDGHRTGLPVGQPLNVWVAWLARHRDTLLAMPWADDAVDELADLARQLGERLHPPEPNTGKVSDYPTVAELATAVGCTPQAMHKRLERKGIRPIRVIAGENVYERAALDQVVR
ncbi:hypothetical protein ACT3SZ_16355 [Corynebacterium sp. AOP40-9SA-29]|uniref:hypothetical protein n=1 Tax=Corynebacterium sp. AOP40-9SA-29 TaxID=3457677 RepID=UPI004033FBDB